MKCLSWTMGWRPRDEAALGSVTTQTGHSSAGGSSLPAHLSSGDVGAQQALARGGAEMDHSRSLDAVATALPANAAVLGLSGDEPDALNGARALLCGDSHLRLVALVSSPHAPLRAEAADLFALIVDLPFDFGTFVRALHRAISDVA